MTSSYEWSVVKQKRQHGFVVIDTLFTMDKLLVVYRQVIIFPPFTLPHATPHHNLHRESYKEDEEGGLIGIRTSNLDILLCR